MKASPRTRRFGTLSRIRVDAVPIDPARFTFSEGMSHAGEKLKLDTFTGRVWALARQGGEAGQNELWQEIQLSPTPEGGPAVRYQFVAGVAPPAIREVESGKTWQYRLGQDGRSFEGIAAAAPKP
jgi:hypothetical protein